MLKKGRKINTQLIGSEISNADLGVLSSVQSLSHVQLYDPMDCSIRGFPVHHQFPEPTQTHVHRVEGYSAVFK